MKHIIWLTPGFAADEADSKCIPPLQLLARQLQRQPGVCLHIIALHYPYRQEVFKWYDVDVYPAFCTGPVSKLRIWWRAWTFLRQLLKKYPAAALHSFWLNDAALIGHWASRLFKVKHWITLMGQDARPDNKYLPLFPIHQLKLITLSPFHDEQLYQTTKRRADKIIPWGIDRLELPPSNKPLQNERSIDVLGVGNLIALKDYATFLSIIAQLKKTFPNIKAVLIGDGVERQNLEDLAIQLDITKHLTFTGYLDRAEVLEYMQKSKVFLHTSTYESFGYVFLEALAFGMSVVSRRVGIAEAGARWKVSEKEALTKAVEDTLRATPPSGIALPYTMEKCLNNYLNSWLDNDKKI